MGAFKLVEAATCIKKIRDNSNKIRGYVIMFTDSEENYIQSSSLKCEIKSGAILVDNLQLNSRDQLIDVKINTPKREEILQEGIGIVNFMVTVIKENKLITIPIFHEQERKIKEEEFESYTYIPEYLSLPIEYLMFKLNIKRTTRNLQKVSEILVYQAIKLLRSENIFVDLLIIQSKPKGIYEIHAYRKSDKNFSHEY